MDFFRDCGAKKGVTDFVEAGTVNHSICHATLSRTEQNKYLIFNFNAVKWIDKFFVAAFLQHVRVLASLTFVL